MSVTVMQEPAAVPRIATTLLPIMGEFGVEPGEPMVAPVHNIIAG